RSDREPARRVGEREDGRGGRQGRAEGGSGGEGRGAEAAGRGEGRDNEEGDGRQGEGEVFEEGGCHAEVEGGRGKGVEGRRGSEVEGGGRQGRTRAGRPADGCGGRHVLPDDPIQGRWGEDGGGADRRLRRGWRVPRAARGARACA